MNKMTLVILGIITLISAQVQVQADIVGLQIGTSSWTPDYSGTLVLDSSTTTGTPIDVEDDLGFSDESHSVVWVEIEHPVPVLPNFRLVLSTLDASASSTIVSPIIYGGETFTGDIDTRFDMSNTELTLYYELLDNWINLDAGLSVRQYDGVSRVSSSTASASADLDFAVPLIYLDARIDLPFTGFFIDSTLNTISIDDSAITETLVGLGYESDFGIGGRLGYRSLELEFDEADLDVDLEFEGMYLNVFYHF
ncbi:MAG: TIGR04219 family outer membrane beta-barrel protein [Gammaproteobacteria bacterium]|nr:TIGR04219 family outer membrane beta-barrel protein [Gammaproteobacteria bacterium]